MEKKTGWKTWVESVIFLLIVLSVFVREPALALMIAGGLLAVGAAAGLFLLVKRMLKKKNPEDRGTP